MTTPSPVSVTALTGGENVPSARFRVRALLPHLDQHGVTVNEKFPRISKYPPASKIIRPLWFVGSTASRIPGILASRKTDVTLLQREFISTLFTLERMTKAPRVLDVDDAIHLHRKGVAAKKLAECCEMILCGNEFLADWYQQYCSNVEIIPTSIDAERFLPGAKHQEEIVRIGWTGLHSNLKYLYQIEDSLATVFKERPNTRLKIISDQRPRFERISPDFIEFSQWSASTEASALSDIDIGIMPLADSEWERGKCAFKLLQYMSTEIAVVGSPVGVNKKILRNNEVGLSASTNKDWTENLLALIDNLDLRNNMGATGREKILAEYDSKNVAQNLSKHLKKIV